jgi:outer membrane protein assembly factor BamB
MPGPAPDPANGVEIRWQFTTEAGDVRTTPAVVDGAAYFGGNDGYLSAVSLHDGAEIWQIAISVGFNSNPAVVDGTVFVGSEDGQCHAIDATTGEERWRLAIGPNPGSPAVSDGTVVIVGDGQSEATLYAIDARDGTERWRFANETIGYSAPAVSDTMVFLDAVSTLHALDLETGEERWRTTKEVGYNDGLAAVNDTVYVSDGGLLLALDAHDGTEQWRTAPDQFTAGAIAVAGDTVYIGSGEFHTVAAVNAHDGSRRWLHTLDGIEPDPDEPSRYGYGHVVVADGTVFATRGFSEVRSLDMTDGTAVWIYQLPSSGKTALSAPVVVDGLVLVGSQDGSMYALGSRIPKLGPGGTARVTEATALRGAPSSTAVERAMLEPDTMVTITDESEGTGNIAWWPVVTDTGGQGWVDGSSLEPLTSGPTPEPTP